MNTCHPEHRRRICLNSHPKDSASVHSVVKNPLTVDNFGYTLAYFGSCLDKLWSIKTPKNIPETAISVLYQGL